MTTYHKRITWVVLGCLALGLMFRLSDEALSEQRSGTESESDSGALTRNGAVSDRDTRDRNGSQNREDIIPSSRNPFYFANQHFDDNVKKYGAKMRTDDQLEPKPPVVSGNAARDYQVKIIDDSGENDENEIPPERPSLQDQAKKLLGIDAQKVFGVDMDAERHALHAEMKMKTDVRLVNMLSAQGIDAELIEKHLKIRQALKEKSKTQALGTKSYRIETGLEELPSQTPTGH